MVSGSKSAEVVLCLNYNVNISADDVAGINFHSYGATTRHTAKLGTIDILIIYMHSVMSTPIIQEPASNLCHFVFLLVALADKLIS
jgi:hypothetical protein